VFFQLPHWFIGERFERNGYAFLMAWMGSLDATAPQLSLHDIKESQKALSQPGSIQAITNYYRALIWYRNSAAYLKRPISTPVLVLWGLRDTALMPELAEMSMKYCLNGKLETIDTTHWVPYEKPDWVNERIDAFFTAA
jgi:epoxide hydrolase 4